MNIAIIPARGGSKRIPKKNIKLFAGKPIIAHSIEAALESKCFDRVIVSTDCEEIAAVANQYGAQTPFIRPTELSGDFTPTADVTSHALQYLKSIGHFPKYTCVLYATAPFITPVILKEAREQLLNQPNKEYCFGVAEFSFPIQRAIKITENGGVEMFQPEHFNSRSQDLEKAFHDAGQFYWGKSEAFLDKALMFSQISTPYIIPSERVQDIDTCSDWNKAELLYQLLAGQPHG